MRTSSEPAASFWHRTVLVILVVLALQVCTATATSKPPLALICTPPAVGGLKSHQAVLPYDVPSGQAVGSGSPPPNGRPSRLGSKRSGCVVASVVSSASR